ncbi:hypothetical protein [Streptomyces sp. NPDC007172]|uniref:hypothetical protein n=1 Tax=Streptomyces sp. NPDC007172 TaxID=3364776 RepID=UPI0036C4F944
MEPPAIGIGSWWTVSAVSTVWLWLYLVPLMPQRAYKLRVAAIPVLGAVFVMASVLVKGVPLERLLPMYATALCGLLLGLLGQGAKVRELMGEMVESGRDRPRNSVSVNVQLAVSCSAMLVLWGWLTHFGTR